MSATKKTTEIIRLVMLLGRPHTISMDKEIGGFVFSGSRHGESVHYGIKTLSSSWERYLQDALIAEREWRAQVPDGVPEYVEPGKTEPRELAPVSRGSR